ncbi:unnamed protein product [Echinostoma caproni]|uniref:C2 domain-containing protein n=1 Tax=Echinostoma caproni TaxID=27848 RepID=A0A183ARS9_9TREM|nr:unnamed protein product [Echinostoma caproni]
MISLSTIALVNFVSVVETPSWNRTFHFNNRSLNLTLEITDKPSHWILNYIFGILAHERLGYQNIAFVQRDWDRPEDAINRLACLDSECNELPEVHINLNVWLPLGTTASFWAPANKVTDHGPLGPVSRWAVLSDRGFVDRLLGDKLRFEHTCSRSPWSSPGLSPRHPVQSGNTCIPPSDCNETGSQQGKAN